MLRMPDVERATGMRRSTIYARIARGEFPAPLRISSHCSVWQLSEIETWIASLRRGTRTQVARATKRDDAADAPGSVAAAAR